MGEGGAEEILLLQHLAVESSQRLLRADSLSLEGTPLSACCLLPSTTTSPAYPSICRLFFRELVPLRPVISLPGHTDRSHRRSRSPPAVFADTSATAASAGLCSASIA